MSEQENNEKYHDEQGVWNHPILRFFIHKTDPDNKYNTLHEYKAVFPWIQYGAYEHNMLDRLVYKIELDGLTSEHVGLFHEKWTLFHCFQNKCAFIHAMNAADWEVYKALFIY
jgi:hypothetical protein